MPARTGTLGADGPSPLRRTCASVSCAGAPPAARATVARMHRRTPPLPIAIGATIARFPRLGHAVFHGTTDSARRVLETGEVARRERTGLTSSGGDRIVLRASSERARDLRGPPPLDRSLDAAGSRPGAAASPARALRRSGGGGVPSARRGARLGSWGRSRHRGGGGGGARRGETCGRGRAARVQPLGHRRLDAPRSRLAVGTGDHDRSADPPVRQGKPPRGDGAGGGRGLSACHALRQTRGGGTRGRPRTAGHRGGLGRRAWDRHRGARGGARGGRTDAWPSWDRGWRSPTPPRTRAVRRASRSRERLLSEFPIDDAAAPRELPAAEPAHQRRCRRPSSWSRPRPSRARSSPPATPSTRGAR